MKQPKPMTRAQKLLLNDVKEKGDFVCHEDYAPAKALITRGVVTSSKVAGIGSARIRLTLVKGAQE